MSAPARARARCAAIATALLWASIARAQDGETAPPEYLDEAPDVGLLPAHQAELLAGTDAVSLFLPKIAPALGLGVEGLRAVDARQRYRMGIHLGVMMAAEPETNDLAVHLWPGLRYRHSFYMDDLFDWYAVLRADFPVGSDPWRAGTFAPGLGVGVRLARVAAIEAAAIVPMAIFSEIELDGERSRVWGAFGVSITVDLCRIGADCEPAPARQRVHDRTSELYAQAHCACLHAERVQRHAPLCEAVMRALDGGEHPPAQGEDSTAAFLRALIAELRPMPGTAGLERELARIRDTHQALDALRKQQREASRIAAQGDHTLRDYTVYTPSALELRRVLGCFPSQRPASVPACPAVDETAQADDAACTTMGDAPRP